MVKQAATSVVIVTDSSITLSIVSHRQNGLVSELLQDLKRHVPSVSALILTQNIPDPVVLATSGITILQEVLINERPKGFGANHNAAFARCRTPYFCVVNPDIRLNSDPFPALLTTLTNSSVGAVGPLVRDPAGMVQDSARRFPTLSILLRKLLADRTEPDYSAERGPVAVDWIAGMFMLFRSEAYRAVHGFDESYFLYYEDVDLCRRLHRAGTSIMYDPAAEVVHYARRASHKDARYALRHLASAVRYFSRY